MGLLDFLSQDAGQQRRAWLDKKTGGLLDALQYYVGPGVDVRQMGGILGMLNPVQDIGEAMGNARDGDYTGAAINTASALMPVAGAKLAGGQIADDVGNIISDTLTNVGTKAQGAMQAGQAFAADEFGGVGPSKGIRAYHGSPHDFDRFSMDAIGTGEGAQAYGHGLYFAENEGVAKGYRDRISGAKWVDRNGLEVKTNDIVEDISKEARKAGFGVVEADEMAFNWRDYLSNPDTAPDPIKSVLNQKGIRLDGQGRMYEVNINANPDDFLDWDAPLSEQPRVMQRLGLSQRTEDEINAEAMRLMEEGNAKAGRAGGWMDDPQISARIDALNAEINNVAPNVSGESLYRSGGQGGAADLMSQLGGGSPKFRAQELREAGIPGIKYRDAGSRGMDGDSGTRNYVVFDENLIEIVRKYGIAGAAAMLGVSASEVQAAMGQQQQPQGLFGSLAGVQ